MSVIYVESNDSGREGRTKRFLQKTAAAGFAFFLIKGLAWLIVPALIWAVKG